MTLLITGNDIAKYKPFSANINFAKKLEPFILESQEFDLKKLLGPAMYLDLIKDFNGSPSLEKYSDIYNEKEFIYKGEVMKHEGLIPVVSYFAYARYVLFANNESTAFGTVTKNNEHSAFSSDKSIQRMSDQAVSAANEYWKYIEMFLNISDFDLWKKKDNKTITSNRMKGI